MSEDRLELLEQRINRLEQWLGAPSGPRPAATGTRPVAQHSRGAPPQRVEPFDLTRLLTARTLAWVGGVVILAGLALLFAMAIDRGWITEEMRVVSGALFSGLLLVAASTLRKRFGSMEAALAAGAAGIGGLFASDVAAGSLYGLITDPIAIVFALLIGVIGVSMALSWDRESIACLGLGGAVIAPLVFLEDISTGNLEIVALVLAAAVTLYLAKRWRVAMAIVSTVALSLAAGWMFEETAATSTVLTFAALFGGLVTFAGIGYHLVNRDSPLTLHSAGLVLSGAGVVIQAVVTVTHGELYGISGLGLALAGLAAVYLLGSVSIHIQPLASLRDLRTLLWGIGLVLLAGSVPLVFDGIATISAFAGIGALVAFVAGRLEEPRLLAAGVAYAIVGACLAFNVAPPEHLFDEGAEGIAFGREIIAIMAAAAGAIGIALLSRAELRLWAGWSAAGLAIYAASLGVVWAFSASVDAGEASSFFQSAQTTVSILWGGIGLAVMIAGLRAKVATLRTGGFLLLGLALSKLVLYDLTVLTAMARVVSFLVLGLVLLVAAALHQRLAEEG